MSVDATIVISTFNRASALPPTLAALGTQTVAPDRYEVIVVDDGSEDDTQAVLAATQTLYALRVLRHDVNRGVSAGRNTGMREARGEILIFISDDVVVSENFVAEHIDTHARFPDAWVVGGFKQLDELAETPFGRYLEEREADFERQRTGRALDDEVSELVLPTARNLSLPRADLERVGYFDEQFRVACEDQDLAVRAVAAGIRFLYNDAIHCIHNDHHVELGRYCRQQERGAADTVRFVRKHPEPHARSTIARRNRPISRGDGPALVVVEARQARAQHAPGAGADRSRRRRGGGAAAARPRAVPPLLAGDRPGDLSRLADGRAPVTAVSVIVPTHRRPAALQATLVALRALEHDDHELIVVEDTDGRGAAATRNEGARKARGEFLLFVDDDILVRPDHLARHLAVHARHPRALVNGEWEFTPEAIATLRATPFGRYRLALEQEFRRTTPGSVLADGCIALEAIPSQDLSLRRELFEELGGFDETFPAAGAEDREFSYRALAAGCTLLRDPSIRLLHNDDRVSLADFCRREERNAATFVVLARRYPDDAIARSYLDAATGAKARVKALASRGPALRALMASARLLERARAPKRVLARCYSMLAGLHIFRGVRSALRQP